MKKAILFFALTFVFWAISIVMSMRLWQIFQEVTNVHLAVIEAPGSAFFEIEDAGTVWLWHNYEDYHEGEKVTNDPQLPSGFNFELKPLGGGTPVPFEASKFRPSGNPPGVSTTGLGTFSVTSPGDYELTVTSPPGQSRLISLTEKERLDGNKEIYILLVGAVVPAFIGLVTLLLGIVFVIAKPKSPPFIPPHAS